LQLEQLGGSKFTEIANIFEVLEKDGVRIAEAVKARTDDREALLRAGASERAFLPSTKAEADPEGLPEALYYKVDGVKGKLGIEKIGNLDPATRILVRREKSAKDDQGREKVPCSFTVIQGNPEDMPDTDYATVIVGREGGDKAKDELWTIHPGAPIRAAQGDFLSGSESLPGPEDGKKQRVMVTTVQELLNSGRMTKDDYVKIVPGSLDASLSQYETAG